MSDFATVPVKTYRVVNDWLERRVTELADWFSDNPNTGDIADALRVFVREQVAELTHNVLTATEERDQKDKEINALANRILDLSLEKDALTQEREAIIADCVEKESSKNKMWYELVASQAREELLRELLPHNLPGGFVGMGKHYAENAIKFAPPSDPMSKFKSKWFMDCAAALALPADDTALQQRLAAERERCAKLVDTAYRTVCLKEVRECAAAIRSMK